jgi:hypothetical protein
VRGGCTLAQRALISLSGSRGVVLAMDEVVDVGVATVAAGRESYPLGESGPGGSTDLDILVLLKSQKPP